MKKASLMLGLAAMMLPNGGNWNESIYLKGERTKIKRKRFTGNYTEKELFTMLNNDLLEGKEKDSVFIVATQAWDGNVKEFNVKAHNIKNAQKKLIKLINYYRD